MPSSVKAGRFVREEAGQPSPDPGPSWAVRLLQIGFLLVSLVNLDQPFVSAHNERQNQTFDTARHVFRGSWRDVVAPKASFSLREYEPQPFTAVPQELPFHGVLGWPLVRIFGHERAVVRLVSVAFALLSIQFIYLILREWVDAFSSGVGAALWTLAPLVLHLGEAPMPDILCTAGMLGAFRFALRGRLALSSGWFAFSLLAKVSVLPFGLPVLVALLTSNRCRSLRQRLGCSLLWGLPPLVVAISWIVIAQRFSPPTPWTLAAILSRRSVFHSPFAPGLWLMIGTSLTLFGAGIMGVILLLSARKELGRLNRWILYSILISNFFYFVTVVPRIGEFQYLLPSLAWVVLLAALGVPPLLDKVRSSQGWRRGIGAAIAAHLLMAGFFTFYLKSSRLASFEEVQLAATAIPRNARVIVVYPHYGASPAVWLDRNVIAVGDLEVLQNGLPKLLACRFSHLLILDLEDRRSALLSRFTPGRTIRRHSSESIPLAAPSSPVRAFCDRQFTRLLEQRSLVLYALPAAEP